MRRFKLHTKTTLLSSAIIVAMLLATLMITSAAIAHIERNDDRTVRAAARSPLSALFEDLPSLDELERRYLLYILDVASGNRTRAAEILRIDRRTLYRIIERYGIESNGE